MREGLRERRAVELGDACPNRIDRQSGRLEWPQAAQATLANVAPNSPAATVAISSATAAMMSGSKLHFSALSAIRSAVFASARHARAVR
jgi:hypothetical protein